MKGQIEMREPRLGEIVGFAYRIPDVLEPIMRPAIVIYCYDAAPVDLLVFTNAGVMPMTRVYYDADKAAGSWHWLKEEAEKTFDMEAWAKQHLVPPEPVDAMSDGEFLEHMRDKDHVEWARQANRKLRLHLSAEQQDGLAGWFANAMVTAQDRKFSLNVFAYTRKALGLEPDASLEAIRARLLELVHAKQSFAGAAIDTLEQIRQIVGAPVLGSLQDLVGRVRRLDFNKTVEYQTNMLGCLREVNTLVGGSPNATTEQILERVRALVEVEKLAEANKAHAQSYRFIANTLNMGTKYPWEVQNRVEKLQKAYTALEEIINPTDRHVGVPCSDTGNRKTVPT